MVQVQVGQLIHASHAFDLHGIGNDEGAVALPQCRDRGQDLVGLLGLGVAGDPDELHALELHVEVAPVGVGVDLVAHPTGDVLQLLPVNLDEALGLVAQAVRHGGGELVADHGDARPR